MLDQMPSNTSDRSILAHTFASLRLLGSRGKSGNDSRVGLRKLETSTRRSRSWRYIIRIRAHIIRIRAHRPAS
eukprot:4010296-Pleurochrysis_carterae.AAC.2